MRVAGLSKERSAEAVAVLARAFHNRSAFFMRQILAMRLLQQQFALLVNYCCIHGEPYTIAGRV
jgi:hypothetical protein